MARATIFNISALFHYFRLYILKSGCAFSKSRAKTGMRRRPCVLYAYCTILILYLRIQYHFSAASRQTGANRRKNVFVVGALIWESVAFYRGDISFKCYHSRIFILLDIFTSLQRHGTTDGTRRGSFAQSMSFKCDSTMWNLHKFL